MMMLIKLVTLAYDWTAIKICSTSSPTQPLLAGWVGAWAWAYIIIIQKNNKRRQLVDMVIIIQDIITVAHPFNLRLQDGLVPGPSRPPS